MKHFLAFSVGSLLLASAASAQTLRHVRIDTPDAAAVAASLEDEGFGILEGSVTTSSFEVIDNVQNLAVLEDRGFAPTLLAIGRPYREIQGEAAPPAGYQDLAQVNTRMNQIAAANPGIAKVVDITATYGAPSTFEGRHIFGLKISDNVNVDEDEPAALIVGAHHVRELVTVVISFEIIDQLMAGYGSNPAITSIVNGNELWVVPVWNPDGYEYVFNVDNLWRKNRHVFSTGVGVDLNRNYPFKWNGACRGSTTVSNETYRGPSAGSEAETQTMMLFSEEERFAKVLDYHSFGRETLYGYASCDTYVLNAYIRGKAIELSQQSGYGNSIRLPSANGEHPEWQLDTYGSFAYLIETATSFQPSFASAQNEATLVTPGAMWLLQQEIPVSGHVTDAITGQPLRASITYDFAAFTNGETNTSDPDTGRYHAFLPPGPQTLTFNAPGYIPRQEAYFVRSGVSLSVDVDLVPVGVCPAASVRKRTTPTNPDVYTATLPIVGQPVTFTVDTQGFQFATIYAVGSPAARPSDRGFVNVEVDSTPIFVLGPLSGPIAQTQMIVANDISLCGMIIYTQAKIHNASGPFQITNSQDLRIGL